MEVAHVIRTHDSPAFSRGRLLELSWHARFRPFRIWRRYFLASGLLFHATDTFAWGFAQSGIRRLPPVVGTPGYLIASRMGNFGAAWARAPGGLLSTRKARGVFSKGSGPN
jgi:hypothetical protein